MQCNKRKQSRWAKSIGAVYFALAVCLGAGMVGCGSTKVIDITTFEEISLAKLAALYGYDNFKAAGYVVRATVRQEVNGTYSLYEKDSGTTFNQFYATELRETTPDLHERLEENREYVFYLAARSRNALAYLLDASYNSRLYTLHVVQIDGLRTVSEIAAEKQAKKDAEEQRIRAAQKADEEANRYDPADFYFLTGGFRPADYTRIDLFDAVTSAEKLPRNWSNDVDWLGMYSRLYVSDVVCVGQNGTNIAFRTDDNAIQQTMSISGRSGLSGGEKVRVYYTITKAPLLEWRVRAIQRR